MTTENTMTVAEIATSSMAAVRVFEKFGIDYCCGGKRPLEDVCRDKGLDPVAVREEIWKSAAGTADQGVDWNTTPLAALIEHIVTTHHQYLKLELPRLSDRLAKVVRVYGDKDRELLSALPEIYAALRSELELHMRKEEFILFPAIERYENAYKAGAPLPVLPFGSVGNPIAMMEAEHSSAGDALAKIRELSRDYTIPEHACVTYRALLSGLKELERDLHQHIHLENNILFPRVLEMER